MIPTASLRSWRQLAANLATVDRRGSAGFGGADPRANPWSAWDALSRDWKRSQVAPRTQRRTSEVAAPLAFAEDAYRYPIDVFTLLTMASMLLVVADVQTHLRNKS